MRGAQKRIQAPVTSGIVDDTGEPAEHEVDPDVAAPQVPVPLPRSKPSSLRRKTAGGALLAAAMIGVQEALEGPREEPAVVEVGNSDTNDDEPVALDLDPEDPAQSIAVVRPWLRRP